MPRPSVLLSLWAVPAGLMVLQMYTSAYVNRTPMPPLGAIGPASLEWLIWAPLTPVVIALDRRYPLLAGFRWRHALIHLLGIGAASALRAVVYMVATAVFVGWTSTDPTLLYLRRITLGWLPIAAVVYGAILGFGSALEFALESRRAQMDALRAQLHPHFLFNALHAVSSLVRAGERSTAVRMIAELSALLRESLRRDAPDETALREEIELTRRYLEIMALRFQDRMTVEWRIQPGVENARVPRMVLQPLVENAVRHGIAPHGDAGRIAIDAELADGKLRLQVRDDGPGPGSGSASGGASEGAGSGLTGIRARVRHLYGADASLELAPAEPRGAVATLIVPHRPLS